MNLSCRDATRLLSDALDRPLAPVETEDLDSHLRRCPRCVECGRQFRLLREIILVWRERTHLHDEPSRTPPRR